MRADATDAEALLWEELRARRLEKLKFKRQVPIAGYIVDFVCMKHKLIIEVDGVQHAGSGYDRVRDAKLKSLGFHTLRFWNDEVECEIESVCDTIIATINEMHPSPKSD